MAAKPWARLSAFAPRLFALTWFPFLRALPPRCAGLPNFTPRRFATARAVSVRSEIISLADRDDCNGPEGHAVGVEHIHRDKLDSAISKGEQKRRVARQAIELRDDSICPVDTTSRKRLRQLGAVVALPDLDLDELGHQRPATTVEVILERLPLHLQPETAAPCLEVDLREAASDFQSFDIRGARTR